MGTHSELGAQAPGLLGVLVPSPWWPLSQYLQQHLWVQGIPSHQPDHGHQEDLGVRGGHLDQRDPKDGRHKMEVRTEVEDRKRG